MMNKEERKQYDAARWRAKKTELRGQHDEYRDSLLALERKLKSVPCVDCGKTFPHYMMEWDHLPNYPKIDAPYNLARRGRKQALLDEIKKCEAVCANHHRERTYLRRCSSVR